MKTNGPTTGIKKKIIFAVSALAVLTMVLLSCIIVTSADARAEIQLQDEEGNEKIAPIMEGSYTAFYTVSTDGIVTFNIVSDQPINVTPTYLAIDADVGTYQLTISATGVEGSVLELTGIDFCLEDTSVGDDSEVFHAILVKNEEESENFVGIAMDGDDVAKLKMDGRYKISVYPAGDYPSSTVPPVIDASSITFTFKIEPSEGWREVTFTSEGEVILTTLLEENGPVGTLPDVSRPGYTLDGWYCEDILVTETEPNVSELPVNEEGVSVINAVWILTPSGDWPKITDRLVEEQVYEDKKFQKWETTYLWQDGSKYIIESDIYVDLQDKYLDGVANATFKVKGQEECTLWISDDGERVLVAVPQINNLFLQ